MAVAGRGGKIDSRVLGNWLAHHAADRVVNLGDDLAPQLVAMEACGRGKASPCGVWRSGGDGVGSVGFVGLFHLHAKEWQCEFINDRLKVTLGELFAGRVGAFQQREDGA